MNKKETILCASNFYDDMKIHTFSPTNISRGFIICGHRHHNCIESFAERVGFPYSKEAQELHNTEEQGFLTNLNRFVDRKEAMKIAIEAEQVEEDKLHNPRIGLFSEDLY